MLIDVVNSGWVPIYNLNLSEDVPGYIGAPAIALDYPWTPLHQRSPRPARHPRRRRGAPAVHRRHRSQRERGARLGRPDPLLRASTGRTSGPGSKATWTPSPSAPPRPSSPSTPACWPPPTSRLHHHHDVPIMQSLRLDLGLGVSRPVNP